MSVLLLTLALLADGPSPPAAIDGVPRWRSMPSGEAFLKVYPRAALREELPGRAVIVCRVTATGHLGDCSVAEETPPGKGFGAAALKLAPFFRLSLVGADGKSTEGAVVRIPLQWRPPPF